MTEHWQGYIFDGIERGGGPIPFGLTQWDFLSPVTRAIQQALPAGGRVLDVGCGAGVYTALLNHHGFDVLGVDQDDAIVGLARKNAEYLRSEAQIEQGDAFDLGNHHGKFDLAFSLGVVEHFDADVTVELLREQACCAPIVVVVVPTRLTHHTGPVTDERFYRREQVSGLVRRAGMSVESSIIFGDVPTTVGRVMRWAVPKVAANAIARITTFGMGICCVGRAATPPPRSRPATTD